MRALAYLQLVDIAAVFSLYSLSHFLFSFLFSLHLFSIPASALLTPISELSHFSICGDVFNPLSYSCIYSNLNIHDSCNFIYSLRRHNFYMLNFFFIFTYQIKISYVLDNCCKEFDIYKHFWGIYTIEVFRKYISHHFSFIF